MADREARSRSPPPRSPSPAPRSPPKSPAPVAKEANGGSKSPVRAGSRSPPPKKSPARSRSPVRRRSPSRSRSRSPRRRSPRRRSRSPPRRRSRSPRRRSRSRSPRRRSRSPRRRSRSPVRARKVSRSRSPSPCKVLGIFGLHPSTTASDLRRVCNKYGELDHVDLITDHQTGRSKCFGFVYFNQVADAAKAKEGLVGLTMEGRNLRIDFSYTKKAHSPTPGRYLGRSHRRRSGGSGRDRDRDRYDGGGRGRRDDYDRYDRYDRRSPDDDYR